MRKRFTFLFPGQGSQYVGMGHDLAENFPDARDIFEAANDTLGFDLKTLCFEGPEDQLRLTQYTQPAILTHSVALLRLLQKEGLTPVFTAGHSLGEYSAHVAAGTMTFTDAVSAVHLRGQLMYQSGVERPGTMAAIVGLTPAQVEDVCAEASKTAICQAANFNSPQQTVISGEVAGVQKGMEIALEKGASKAIQLDVSGAFHSELMAIAKTGLQEKLNQIAIQDAQIQVIANLTARPVQTAGDIRNALVEQLDHPVRWVETIQYLAENEPGLMVEIGPGKVLRGLMRRIDRSLNVVNVDTVSDLDKFMNDL